MGLTLQFAVGPKDVILDAIRDEDFHYLESLEEAGDFADFSLHLEPRDLDYLVRVASSTSGGEVKSLREHLLFDESAVDEQDRGGVLVSNEIVLLFSHLNPKDGESIAKAWYKQLSLAYPEETIEYDDDAGRATTQLIGVCKKAKAGYGALVHIWFL
jgi:hypothetical protein